MASRGVSILKFVGTISLGLLTGVSYSLTNLTVPTLLTLPSAETAARALNSLTTSAYHHLRLLTAVSSSALALSFFLSPRPHRHPYLLYTAVFAAATSLSDIAAPYLLPASGGRPSSSSSSSAAASAEKKKNKETRRQQQAHMEASYEVLGNSAIDAHSQTSEEEIDEENVNGEEVRLGVERFVRSQMVAAATAGLGFAMAVVGIWGDGVVPVLQSETLIIGA